MAIISCPGDMPPHAAVCVICKKEMPLHALSAGLYDANYRQAFACDDHFREPNRLIIGWTDFVATERQRHLRLHANSLLQEEHDEWFIY